MTPDYSLPAASQSSASLPSSPVTKVRKVSPLPSYKVTKQRNARFSDKRHSQIGFSFSRSLSLRQLPCIELQSTKDSSPECQVCDLLSQDGEECQDENRLVARVLEKILGGTNAHHEAQSWSSANLSPPVTSKSLAELDIKCMAYRPQLRYDLNFDRDLQVRPNFAGSKGTIKRQAHRDYWHAIAAELKLSAILNDRQHFPHEICRKHRELLGAKRLPRLLDTIKEIITKLVPEKDSGTVDLILDTELIIQEIAHGCFNAVPTVELLALLLKRHCAPVRDGSINKMVKKMTMGDAAGISEGMRDILAICEVMKLDIVNHQIRHLRPLLIEDSVDFAQQYYRKRLNQSAQLRMHAYEARNWYLTILSEYRNDVWIRSRDEFEFAIFIQALLDYLLCSYSQWLVDIKQLCTFREDSRVLSSIQIELRALQIDNHCQAVFKSIIDGLGVHSSKLQAASSELSRNIRAIISPKHSAQPIDPSEEVKYASLEIMRLVLKLDNNGEQYSDKVLQKVEMRLRASLYGDAGSDDGGDQFKQSLYFAVMRVVSEFKCLRASPYDLFNALAPQRSHRRTPSVSLSCGKRQPTDPLTAIAQRIAHVASLHWRIWSEMVYLNPEFDDRQYGYELRRTNSSDQDALTYQTIDAGKSPAPSPRGNSEEPQAQAIVECLDSAIVVSQCPATDESARK